MARPPGTIEMLIMPSQQLKRDASRRRYSSVFSSQQHHQHRRPAAHTAPPSSRYLTRTPQAAGAAALHAPPRCRLGERRRRRLRKPLLDCTTKTTWNSVSLLLGIKLIRLHCASFVHKHLQTALWFPVRWNVTLRHIMENSLQGTKRFFVAMKEKKERDTAKQANVLIPRTVFYTERHWLQRLCQEEELRVCLSFCIVARNTCRPMFF